MDDYGCRYGAPHDLFIVHEAKAEKWERCRLCNKPFRWNKRNKGRVHNQEYLKAHIRNFAQRWGATKRIYNKVYFPEHMIINL